MKIFIYLLLLTLVCQRGLGKKGKAAFREAFGRVAELRSCLESGTPLLALTATPNKEMRNRLNKCLGMKSGDLIIVSPNKDNIRFTVLQGDKQFLCFNWLLSLLRVEKQDTPFSIIFCKRVNGIVSLLTYFLVKLGNSGLYVDGEGPIHERCLLGVYYSQTPKRHKDCVTSSFEGVSGNVRVVLQQHPKVWALTFHMRSMLFTTGHLTTWHRISRTRWERWKPGIPYNIISWKTSDNLWRRCQNRCETFIEVMLPAELNFF